MAIFYGAFGEAAQEKYRPSVSEASPSAMVTACSRRWRRLPSHRPPELAKGLDTRPLARPYGQYVDPVKIKKRRRGTPRQSGQSRQHRFKIGKFVKFRLPGAAPDEDEQLMPPRKKLQAHCARVRTVQHVPHQLPGCADGDVPRLDMSFLQLRFPDVNRKGPAADGLNVHKNPS